MSALATAPELRPVGRPPKQSDQRQRILQSAAKAIATVGYEQYSLADIAAELDLTRPALYHYFPTKQVIFTEIAMGAMRGISEHVQSCVDESQSSAKQLLALMVAHAEYFESHYWLMSATIAGYAGITRREIERLDEFEGHRNSYERFVHRVLRAGMKSGEFRQSDVKATTRAIFQLLNMTRWFRPDGKKPATDFARENFALLSGGLLADTK